jgi:cytochrome P450 / NADPH-cytochrome P450 reductase
LKVKETLTLKPDGLTMQVRPRQASEGFTFAMNETNSVQETKENQISQMSQSIIGAHNTPLLVLYGSNMGTSEGIARNLAVTARFKGFQSEVATLDDFASELPKAGAIFIVTSSYNGNPPKNARKFVKWLKEVDNESLNGVQYAVFGCGDTNWASTYQEIPSLIDEKLSEKGATRLFQKGQGDASSEFEKQYEEWHEQVWPSVFEAFGLEIDNRSEPATNQLQVQFVNGLSPESVSPSGNVTHKDGHHGVSVLPKNSVELVERVLTRYGLNRDTQLVLTGNREELPHLPLAFPVRVWDLLCYSVDLAETVTHSQLSELAEFTVCPPHKRELELLLSEEEYTLQVVEKGISMLHLLEKYPACELPLERFLELLAPL